MAEENRKAFEERQAATQARSEASQAWVRADKERDGIPISSPGCLSVAATYKKQVLDWLSPVNWLKARHSTTGDRHTQDTGMWLLTELQQWFDGNGPPLIICQGAGNILSLDWLTLRWCWEDPFDV
jgi:hypothetical protein